MVLIMQISLFLEIMEKRGKRILRFLVEAILVVDMSREYNDVLIFLITHVSDDDDS